MNKPHKHSVGEPAAKLGDLLALGLKAGEEWTSEELEAALLEQISVPIEFELSSLRPGEAEAVRARAEAHGLVLKSLCELFKHPKPPIELLVMAKDHFKSNSVRPHPGLPAEVARALYYAAVASAWLRHHARISSLSDEQLLAALEWVRGQGWVPDDVRNLATAAAKDLQGEQRTGNP